MAWNKYLYIQKKEKLQVLQKGLKSNEFDTIA